MCVMEKIGKKHLKAVFDILEERYRVSGPKVRNDTVVLEEITSADMPAGVRVAEAAGGIVLNCRETRVSSPSLRARFAQEVDPKGICEKRNDHSSHIAEPAP
jgi:hypothetical protein